VNNPLAVWCRSCCAFPGERCKNYLGKNKQTCPERGKPATPKAERPKPETEQPSLFDTDEDGQ
jgi:hypothetical protein